MRPTFLFRDATNGIELCISGSQTVTEFTADRVHDVAAIGHRCGCPRVHVPVKRILPLFLLALAITGGAAAQPSSRAPTIGPNDESARSGLWQILTPEQREQLWRILTPEQRTDLWRGLAPQERREMRERVAPNGPGSGMPGAARRHFDQGDAATRTTMTPDERQQMREQIREAHRMQRERMEAERARSPQ
jgi:hypothetical protein